MAFAIIFPGQGSQSVGMMAELAQRYPVIEQTFAEASEVLGYDLWSLAQNGPEGELGRTEKTQPALLAAGVAVFRAWRDCGGPMPAAMAGHSLGEYTALVCAGRIRFPEAIALVQYRGQVMQAAVPAGEGAMAAVLGLEDEKVAEACEAAAQGQVVTPVNFNSPGQVVIAGNSAAVTRAVEAARERGARRAILLEVSVPSHCQLMQGAARQLEQRLLDVDIAPGDVPVYHNVDARPRADGDQVRAALARQLYQPVRWTECVRAMAGAGAATFVEMGPGKVLTGLMRRIDRDLGAMACGDPDALDATLAGIGKEEH